MDGIFYAYSALLKDLGLKMISNKLYRVFYLFVDIGTLFHRVYELGAYNECTKISANISFHCKNSILCHIVNITNYITAITAGNGTF